MRKAGIQVTRQLDFTAVFPRGIDKSRHRLHRNDSEKTVYGDRTRAGIKYGFEIVAEQNIIKQLAGKIPGGLLFLLLAVDFTGLL